LLTFSTSERHGQAPEANRKQQKNTPFAGAFNWLLLLLL